MGKVKSCSPKILTWAIFFPQPTSCVAGGPILTIWDHGGPHQSHQTTIHTPATTQFSSKGISWKCGYWHHPHPTTCKPWISLYLTKEVIDWPWLKNITSICWWHHFQMWLKNSLFTNCDHNKSIYYHTFSTSSLLSCFFKQLIKTALCKLNLPLHQQCGSGIYKDPKRPYCTSVTSGCTVNEYPGLHFGVDSNTCPCYRWELPWT